jgi:nitrilase
MDMTNGASKPDGCNRGAVGSTRPSTPFLPAAPDPLPSSAYLLPPSTVAVVQATPVLFDRAATVEKAVRLAREAARQGARLILFPESFVPAYPRGLSFGAVVGNRTAEGRALFARYAAAAVEVPGAETARLGATARKLGIHLAIGVTERDPVSRGTLYCTLLLFGPDGRIVLHHRKMKPTASERLVWGEGDGSSVTTVQTPLGRVGGLICWENYMPLARAALYAQGVDIYLAPTADARDSWQATIRHIALEGRCFVLACNQYVTRADYPADLDPASRAELDAQPSVMCRGGSAIVGPLGDNLAGPLWDEEGILVAEIDSTSLAAAKFDFDAVGHYARPDVFRLDCRVPSDPHRSPSGAEGSGIDGAAEPAHAGQPGVEAVEARRG